MQHAFHSFGDSKAIAWVLCSGRETIPQHRAHVREYLGKISCLDSRYVALHVGIFWCIGTFRIVRDDTVEILLDDPVMRAHLIDGGPAPDRLAVQRTGFVRQLFSQKGVTWSCLASGENPAEDLIRGGAGPGLYP